VVIVGGPENNGIVGSNEAVHFPSLDSCIPYASLGLLVGDEAAVPQTKETLDARGVHVLPGAIDVLNVGDWGVVHVRPVRFLCR
jgi:hypothetical protein